MVCPLVKVKPRRAATTISGPGEGRVVSISEADGATLRGFTLTNGHTNSGAGLRVASSSDVVLEDLVIRENYSNEPDANCTGVAIVVALGSSVTGRRLHIEANEATCRFTTGVVRSNHASTLILENTAIVANVLDASESSQSPLSTMDGILELRNVIVAGNQTHAGVNGSPAAIALGRPGTYVLENVTVRGNVSESDMFGSGGAIRLGDNDPDLMTVTLVNVTNTNNSVSAPQSAINSGGYSGASTNIELEFNHCNTWGNNPADFTAAFPDPDSFVGNISADPSFVDVTSPNSALWDLRPIDRSPLIDAGNPALLDADGSISDIGAYGGPGSDAWP